MYCGHMKIECNSITLGELEDILKRCKNKNAIIKYSDAEKFFIHFDQDGEFINFSKLPNDKLYGDRGADNKCINCEGYDNKNHKCNCKPDDCMNYLAYYGDSDNSTSTLVKKEEKIPPKQRISKPKDIIVNGEVIGMYGEIVDSEFDNNYEKAIKNIKQKEVDDLIIASLEKMISSLKNK